MDFTRNDLPQFSVRSVEQGALDDDGYITWILHGILSRTLKIPVDTWCFLLLPGHTSLIGTFTISNEIAGAAIFATFAKEKPVIVGVALAQLSAYWRPYHIWMIEDGPDIWSEQVFSASDAVEDTFTAADGRAWRRLAKASATPTDNCSIHLAQETVNHSAARIVPSGWDHEHCSLCNVHIDPGNRFFYSIEYCEFLCVACHQRYVPKRDIGFVFE